MLRSGELGDEKSADQRIAKLTSLRTMLKIERTTNDETVNKDANTHACLRSGRTVVRRFSRLFGKIPLRLGMLLSGKGTVTLRY